MAPRWVVLREREHQRWGGDLRREYVLSALAGRPDALDVSGWSTGAVRAALAGRSWWHRHLPRVVAATLLAPETLDVIRESAVPFALDYHDDPIRQREVLGISTEESWLARERERKARNIEAFTWLIVPSAALAELAGLDASRTIVAGNGTDPQVILPEPWPDQPAVGMMSGAAPRRGIEEMIAAGRLVRGTLPDLRLILWLAATGADSAAYLADLRERVAGEAWIEFASAPYREIGSQIGRVSVQCVPNPPAAYWDAVAPIKLFDAMASGRPVVVTPRRTMSELVEQAACGLTAGGDRPEDLAEAIARLLGDQELARRLGANGRRAAMQSYSWSRISSTLADELVALADAR